MGTLTSRRPPHSVANLRSVQIELGKRSAQRVPMHSKLFGRFALVSSVLREHFEDVAPFELTYGFRIGNAGAMHLRDQTVQFALQSESSPAVSFRNRTFIVPLRQLLDPVGGAVLDLGGTT